LKRGDSRRCLEVAVTDEATHDASRGNALAQISTGLVQLHSRHYGKGPTKAKTYVFDELVACVLRNGFTTVERTLLEAGDGESVHQMRRSFQLAMEGEFRHVVEEATGRQVLAYMSSIHTDPDLTVELFVLEPVPDGLSLVESADGDGVPRLGSPA
jgi:uncharacterized protein YbcI